VRVRECEFSRGNFLNILEPQGEMMKLKDLHEKVRTLPVTKPAPRGAPDDKARAFDSSDRSITAKMENTKFSVTDYDVDWSDPNDEEIMHLGNMVHFTVKSEYTIPGYKGVQVIMGLDNDAPVIIDPDDADLQPIGSDTLARHQVKSQERKIIDACIAAVRAGEVKIGNKPVTLA
jgi:hypothetical protein